MTRDEFIDRYMTDNGIDPVYRTAEGFQLDFGAAQVALPCKECDYEGCDGWQMVSAKVASSVLAQLGYQENDRPPKLDTYDEGVAITKRYYAAHPV